MARTFRFEVDHRWYSFLNERFRTKVLAVVKTLKCFTKLREGSVFTPVCQSFFYVGGGEDGASQGGMHGQGE